jgi:hypothetical protein
MNTMFKASLLLLLFLVIFLSGCPKKDENPSTPSDIWDIDKDGIPTFVTKNYIELSKIYRISKFRSSYGHDYSDAFEHCRSMKHYFEPAADVDWTAIGIYSPVTGTVTRVDQEWAGTKLEIASDDYPAFRFSIFHINLLAPKNLNDKVTAGELLGHHIGSQTMSDISVIVNDPTKQGRMVSYFKVIDDNVFNEYKSRGVTSRDEMIISKELRDANPLTCNGDQFNPGDTLEAWVILAPVIR